MPEPSEREAFRNLLIDYWAIRAAETLGDVALPDAEMLEKYREIAAAQADKVLQSYERELQVDKLADSVIERLRDDLVPRSRAARLIEVAINVSALVIGGLIGLSQFIFDPVANAKQISAVYYALMFIVILQLLGNLYLKFFDRKR